jgi:hypothetical protein
MTAGAFKAKITLNPAFQYGDFYRIILAGFYNRASVTALSSGKNSREEYYVNRKEMEAGRWEFLFAFSF